MFAPHPSCMDVDVTVEEEGSGRNEEHTVTVEEDAVVEDVLDALDINPGTVLVERNGTVITHKDAVEAGEALRVLTVISGG